MRLICSFLILNLLLLVNCSSKLKPSNNDFLLIEITDIQYGKIPSRFDKKVLSKITHLSEKNFSSGVGGSYLGKIIDFPINDKLFNHEYFIKYDYNLNKKAILHLQKYIYNKEEYLIAIKIEDVK
jgi:hypothetical protein